MTTNHQNDVAEALIAQLQSPEGVNNPWPLYQQLRELAPVYKSSRLNLWFITSYNECRKVLMSDSIGHGDKAKWLSEDPRYENSPMLKSLSSVMLTMDKPRHTRLRGLVQKSFTRSVLENTRLYVEQLIQNLLVSLSERRKFDIIEDYASHIPVSVICNMFGIPDQDHHRFEKWSTISTQAIGPNVPDDILAQADKVVLEAQEYITSLIDERSTTRGQDLMSELIAVEEVGEKLSFDELINLVLQLVAAGSDTTKHLIANSILALLSNPEQMQLLIDDPSMDAKAVEELLRLESSAVTAVPRLVLMEDVKLNGYKLSKGDYVMPVLNAANRDPSIFPDPDRMDFKRRNNPHLAFGSGIHFCLGNVLARMEAQIAIPQFLRRFPNCRVNGEIEWNMDYSGTIRGMKSFPVTV